MELQQFNQTKDLGPKEAKSKKESNFIESNTKEISLDSIKNNHIIPVFVKDNTPAISQVEFIDLTEMLAQSVLGLKTSNLDVRVSHPIKGRIFDARHKKATELLDNEKTIYYERMAFSFDLPQVKYNIMGQLLTLSVVGIKSYSMDNLYSFGGAKQTFKLGIGFKVKVCTNMCLWSDGVSLEIKARNLDELGIAISELFSNASFEQHIPALKGLGNYDISEKQFAHILGKARMYNHLPNELKKGIPELLISDTQVSAVTKEYYRNLNFKRNPNGSINLWNLYNLFTESVKSSYIDTFLDRGVNAFTFNNGIAQALEQKGDYSWFLS